MPASDGFGIFYRRWSAGGEAQRAVICSHGIEGHSAFFRTLGTEMAKEGTEVYAFDRRGFGNSAEEDLQRGDTRNFGRQLADYDDFVLFVRKNHPGKKVFMFGHSLGTAYAVWYAAGQPGKLDGLILAAPPVKTNTNPPASDLVKLLFLGVFAPHSRYKFLAKWPAPFKDTQEFRTISDDPLSSKEFGIKWLVGLRKITGGKIMANGKRLNIPTLVLHGDADMITPIEGARKLYEALLGQDKSLKVFPEANHHLYRVIFPEEPADAHTSMMVTMTVTDWLSAH